MVSFVLSSMPSSANPVRGYSPVVRSVARKVVAWERRGKELRVGVAFKKRKGDSALTPTFPLVVGAISSVFEKRNFRTTEQHTGERERARQRLLDHQKKKTCSAPNVGRPVHVDTSSDGVCVSLQPPLVPRQDAALWCTFWSKLHLTLRTQHATFGLVLALGERFEGLLQLL